MSIIRGKFSFTRASKRWSQTVFAIAHRLLTVRNDDQIVLEDGEIVERSPHHGLLGGDGLYTALWRVRVGEVDALSEEFLGVAARDRACYRAQTETSPSEQSWRIPVEAQFPQELHRDSNVIIVSV